MKLNKLVLKNRSYRRFDQSVRVDKSFLVELVALARLSASGNNRQALKFVLVNEKEECDRLFPFTNWAGYLKNWPGPAEGERPSAYVVILGDHDIADNYLVDHGIAAQSILLGATEAGLGGCMIGSIRRMEMRKEFDIPERYEILLIIALGKPAEKIVIDEAENNNIKYWRDKDDVHHVPKRSVDDLIIKL